MPAGCSIPDAPAAKCPAEDLEQLCRRCGRCCYYKIITGPDVFITPFPCEHLDLERHLCLVYRRRREATNGQCLNLEDALRLRALPADCPYVLRFAPTGYRAARTDWNWIREWLHFDSLADDLQVPETIRELVRARGPLAPPLWTEAASKKDR